MLRHAPIHVRGAGTKVLDGFAKCPKCQAVLKKTSMFKHSLVHAPSYGGSWTSVSNREYRERWTKWSPPSPAKESKYMRPIEIDEIIEADIEMECVPDVE
jgi:hypothetical protein